MTPAPGRKSAVPATNPVTMTLPEPSIVTPAACTCELPEPFVATAQTNWPAGLTRATNASVVPPPLTDRPPKVAAVWNEPTRVRLPEASAASA